MSGFRKLSIQAFGIVAAAAVSFTVGHVGPVQAQDTSTRAQESAAPAAGPAHRAGKRYFIEFRSRSALSYGHTFVLYGRLTPDGRVAMRKGRVIESMAKVAGLHPASESPIPYTIGHFLPVPSETGASDGDMEEQYVTARWRVALSEAEFRRLDAFIRKLQANSPSWNAALYNCNAFVGDIARYMGMQAPSHLLYPKEYVNELRRLNGSQRFPKFSEG